MILPASSIQYSLVMSINFLRMVSILDVIVGIYFKSSIFINRYDILNTLVLIYLSKYMEIQLKFLKYIKEGSYTISDVPDKFRVVFDLSDAFDDLSKGVMNGLKGISSSGDIEFQYLGVARDAMLVMDSNDVLKMNKATRIMYDNPKYLVSKNMEALYRIWDKRRDKTGPGGVFFNIFEYIETVMKRNPSDNQYNKFAYDARYYGLNNYGYDAGKVVPVINTIKDFTNFVKNVIENIFSKKTNNKYDLSYSDYEKLVLGALKIVGDVYKDEAEWVIKDNVLKVPRGSEIQVLVDGYDKKFESDMKKLIDYMVKNKEFEKRPETEVLKSLSLSQQFITWAAVNGSYLLPRIAKKTYQIKELSKYYNVIEVSVEDFKRRQSKYFDAKNLER